MIRWIRFVYVLCVNVQVIAGLETQLALVKDEVAVIEARLRSCMDKNQTPATDGEPSSVDPPPHSGEF